MTSRHGPHSLREKQNDSHYHLKLSQRTPVSGTMKRLRSVNETITRSMWHRLVLIPPSCQSTKARNRLQTPFLRSISRLPRILTSRTEPPGDLSERCDRYHLQHKKNRIGLHH